MAEERRSLAEWRAAFAALSPEELWEEALELNAPHGVRELLGEGYADAELEAVFILLAHRFRDAGLAPPLEGWFDLVGLSARPAPGTPPRSWREG